MNDIVNRGKKVIEALIKEIEEKIKNLHHNEVQSSKREELIQCCDNARSTVKDIYRNKVKRILLKNKYEFGLDSSEITPNSTKTIEEISRRVLLGYVGYPIDNKQAIKEIESYRRVFRSYINQMISIEDKINNMYLSKIKNSDDEDIKIEKLNWRILPKGELSFEKVFGYYRKIQRKKPNELYDEGRLISIKKLRPLKCYVGLKEFKGYHVFRFNYSKKAILENPYKGNAIYVLNGDWRSLSQMTKSELLDTNLAHVQRIVHNGDWFGKLQKALQK
jgi:hypothetical protein